MRYFYRMSSSKPNKTPAFFTIDVEEWFHASVVERSVPRHQWPQQESRLQAQMERIVALLEEAKATATFFWLSPLAQKFPVMVRSLVEAGHEIASHGVTHKRLESLSTAELTSEFVESKSILEDLTGQPIYGYRAPNFSITDKALELLESAGYRYDSSVVPSQWHKGYGQLQHHTIQKGAPYLIRPHLMEVPLTVGPLNIPCSGGAYLRHFPYILFERLFFNDSPLVTSLLVTSKQATTPLVTSKLFYLHPWELDALQPLPKGMPWIDKVRHMRNANEVEKRLKRLMEKVQFGRILDAL